MAQLANQATIAITHPTDVTAVSAIAAATITGHVHFIHLVSRGPA